MDSSLACISQINEIQLKKTSSKHLAKKKNLSPPSPPADNLLKQSTVAGCTIDDLPITKDSYVWNQTLWASKSRLHKRIAKCHISRLYVSSLYRCTYTTRIGNLYKSVVWMFLVVLYVNYFPSIRSCFKAKGGKPKLLLCCQVWHWKQPSLLRAAMCETLPTCSSLGENKNYLTNFWIILWMKKNNSKKKPILLWITISRGIFVHCDKPKQKKICGDGVEICFIVVWSAGLDFCVLMGVYLLFIY